MASPPAPRSRRALPTRRAAALALLGAYCAGASWAQIVAPAAAWRSDRLPLLEAQLRASPGIRALLMERQGESFAYLRPGVTASTRANVASVTKTVTSLLVGLAIERGLVASVDEPLAAFFTEHANGPHADALRRVTLRHLLTMSSGFDRMGLDMNSDYPAFMLRLYAPGLLQHALGRRLVAPPGTSFYYSNIDVHLIALALSRRLRTPLAEFARDTLFQPLGIDSVHWPADPVGVPNGASELHLGAAELMRLGRMMLDGGRWQGKQVVPGLYVREATRHHIATDLPPRGPAELWGYGFLTWLASTPVDNLPAFYASGYGGQFVYVVPALDLVVVATTDHISREVAARTAAVVRDFALSAVAR